MTRPDLTDPKAVQAYRADLRTVGRTQRLTGFGMVLLGMVLVLAAPNAGAAGPTVQWLGYAALGAGWVLMLAAIVMRTRYHRRRMREMD